MTFQIWDDVRDLVCSEERLGKPAGHDMVEGTYTLPVLHALAVPGAGDDLRALLGGPLDPPGRNKARDLVLSTDAVTACIRQARCWADQADAALDVLRQGGGSAQRLAVLGQVGHRLIDELDLS
jgi:heptaprenyl diphosphate synthase